MINMCKLFIHGLYMVVTCNIRKITRNMLFVALPSRQAKATDTFPDTAKTNETVA